MQQEFHLPPDLLHVAIPVIQLQCEGVVGRPHDEDVVDERRQIRQLDDGKAVVNAQLVLERHRHARYLRRREPAGHQVIRAERWNNPGSCSLWTCDPRPGSRPALRAHRAGAARRLLRDRVRDPVHGGRPAGPRAHPRSRPPPARPVSIVALGDSVPRGTNCDCTPYPELTGDELSAAAHRTVTATNDSVAGATTDGVLKQLTSQPDVIAHVGPSDAVEIEVGANDVAHSSQCGTSLDCYTPDCRSWRRT